jgi:succinate dehydrogenase / fumarate reductase, cytochrome b subunit
MSTLAVAPSEAGTKPSLTTVSAKYVVALTGVGLVGFVIAHMAGNLLLFAGRDAFNNYAKALEDMGALLWAARISLLAIFVLHIYFAVKLQARNKAARPVGYLRTQHLTSNPASRTMLLTGIVLLVFILFHLAHFTFGYVHQVPRILKSGEVKYNAAGTAPEMLHVWDLKDSKDRRDAYAMTIYGFRNWFITLLYVVAMGFLVLHLYHGGSSMFQSLGINHPRYNPLLGRVGLILAVALGIGNISMPLAVLLRIVGAEVPEV